MQTRRTFLTTLACGTTFALAACGGSNDSASTDAASTTEAAAASGDGTDAKGEGVMTYDEYNAAAVDDEVVVECFVQATQSWWENAITIYAADADGAYFIYNCACAEEDAAKLVEGQKIKVTGYKADFEGEIEIADATFEFEDGSTFISTPVDITDKLGTDELIDFQNQKVSFTGLTVEASKDPDGKEVAFLYNWDGSGAAGDDLYFNVSNGTDTFSFTVESYLTGEDTDVYKTVTETLKVGDTIDMEGFLYWYQGANPHITSVTIK